MIHTRVTEHLPCARRRRPGETLGRRAWSLSSPVLRRGRLQLSIARWPVHVFEEKDYCYGVGPLALRVDRVGWASPVPYEGDTWLEVSGRVIDRRTGEERQTRQVLVRACRLPEPPDRKRPRLRP